MGEVYRTTAEKTEAHIQQEVLVAKVVPGFQNYQGQVPGSTNRIQTAEWLKELARYASWHTANHMKRYRMDAERDEGHVREYYKKLCGNGVLSMEFITIYEAMAWSAAWSTANERFGSKGNAAMYKKQWIENHEKLMKCCEVTPQVANDLRDLCWFSGWFTANTRKGFFYRRDAAEDERKIKMYYERICI